MVRLSKTFAFSTTRISLTAGLALPLVVFGGTEPSAIAGMASIESVWSTTSRPCDPATKAALLK